jgi:hypothetical protein
MSLLLNGAKTITIAGTEMSCIEIYTGEAYTFPFAFTDSVGNPINCTLPSPWTLGTSAKFYVADNITYSTANPSEISIGNLTLDTPQPSTGAGTYSANLTAVFTTPATGVGYLYIPATLTGGTGSPNPTPIVSLANSAANTNIVVVTMSVTRTDALSSLQNISREPIGMIVRYQ